MVRSDARFSIAITASRGAIVCVMGTGVIGMTGMTTITTAMAGTG